MLDNLLFLLLFILVLIVSSLLYYKAAEGLFMPSIIMLFYWFYLFFVYLGSAVLFFGFNEIYANYGVTNSILLWKVWISSAIGFIVIPCVFIILKRIDALKDKRNDVINQGYNKIVLVVATAFSIIPLFFYIIQMSNIPILSILSNFGTSELAGARSEATFGFESKSHWYILFAGNIMPFLSYVSFFEYLKKRSRLFFILFAINIIWTVLTLQKAPLILYLGSIVFAYYIFNKKPIPMRTVLVLSILSICLLMLMYIFFMGFDVGTKGILKLFIAPFSRVIGGSLVPLYYYFEMFPGFQDFLFGRSFPNPGNILPFESYKLTIETMNYINPDLALKGITGSAPTVFFGEMYANFSYIGMIVSMVFVGIVLYLISLFVDKLPKNYITLALSVWIAFHLSKLTMTGFSAVLLNINIIGVILTAIVLSLLSRLINRNAKAYL